MMNQARIRELFALLPRKAAYPPMPRRSPFQPRPTEAERFAFALHDPAFGAHFVAAHLQTGHWLPATVHEWPLLQLYVTRRLKVAEPLLLEVESFRTEARRQERDLLEGLLLARSLNFAAIAGHLNIREEIVEAYEALFWNVRDRLDERGYLTALLYPEGVQAAVREAQPDAVGDRLRLRRVGAHDDAAEVLSLAGYQPRSQAGLDGEPGEVERVLRKDAVRRLRAGRRVEDPVVRAAHAADLHRQEAKQDDDPLALHHINAVAPALEEIRKYNGLGCPEPPGYGDILQEARAKAELKLAEAGDLG